MKKILVPTDFSNLSDNALNYAVQLAKRADAELLLFHAYFVPVFVHDPILMLPTEQELEKDALLALEKLKQSIQKANTGLIVDFYATPGIPVEEINICAKKEKADMIVVGAQGAGYLEERVLGSTAALLIRKAKIPVMVIDHKVRFREPEKIVLAVDFAETDNKTVLKPLKELAALFQSHVCVLNVFPQTEIIPNLGEIAESFRLEHSLKYIHHTFFYTEHADIVGGINSFVKQHHIDMVVMVARKHSVISRLFREPLTKKMAFHSSVPLLILHG